MSKQLTTTEFDGEQQGKKIVELFGYKLTPFERHEILNYDKVFYYGQNSINKLKGYRKKRRSRFHTNKGLYDYIIGDHLNYRYEILGKLGEGGYSIIYDAYDHANKRKVAIKNLINYVTPDTEKLREIEILTELKKHRLTDYAVDMYDYFLFRGFVFITFEKLHIDLDTLLMRRQYGFGQEFVNSIAYSLFIGICTIHNICKIIHCDVKPENLLLIEEGGTKIKLADFGLSCYKSDIDTHIFKQTRYYQAPELLLKGAIGTPIDIWSAGCVIGELLRGQPLFYGDNDFDQLTLIMGLLGMPTENFLSQCDQTTVLKYINEDGFPRYCSVESDNCNNVRLVPKKSPQGDKRALPGAMEWEEEFGPFPDKLLLSFLKQCLTWDPDDRITAEKALRHEYLARRNSSTQIPFTKYPHFSGSSSTEKRKKVYTNFSKVVIRDHDRPSTAAF